MVPDFGSLLQTIFWVTDVAGQIWKFVNAKIYTWSPARAISRFWRARDFLLSSKFKPWNFLAILSLSRVRSTTLASNMCKWADDSLVALLCWALATLKASSVTCEQTSLLKPGLVCWVHAQDRNTVGIRNLDFLKVRFQMVRFSNGQALAMAIAIVPTILKLDHAKSGHFCPDFKWFWTKWRPFVRISKGWAFGLISDPIQNPD